MISRPTLTVAAMLAVPALAYGGATVTDGTDTLKIKGSVKPAKASKSQSQPRAVAFSFDYVAGTTDGSRVADVRSVSVYGGGGVTNYDAFPKCAELRLLDQGPRGMPAGIAGRQRHGRSSRSTSPASRTASRT